MITEAVIRFFLELIASFFAGLPEWEIPAFTGVGAWDSIADAGSHVGSWLGPFDNWLAGTALFQCIGVVAAAWTIAVAVRGIRMVVSHLTGGGGTT